jgi:hypothetical protein
MYLVSDDHNIDGMRTTVSSNSRRHPQTSALSQGHNWRDLIPVIKVDIASVRGFQIIFLLQIVDK